MLNVDLVGKYSILTLQDLAIFGHQTFAAVMDVSSEGIFPGRVGRGKGSGASGEFPRSRICCEGGMHHQQLQKGMPPRNP